MLHLHKTAAQKPRTRQFARPMCGSSDTPWHCCQHDSHRLRLRLTQMPQAAALGLHAGVACTATGRPRDACLPEQAVGGDVKPAMTPTAAQIPQLIPHVVKAVEFCRTELLRIVELCCAELLQALDHARNRAGQPHEHVLFYFLLPCRRLHKSAQASETHPLRWLQGGVGGRSASSPPWCGALPVTALNTRPVQSGGCRW